MLLRRITQHVQTQNWFAVILDFLIVVVGVFIGIQVANWNDALQANLREQQIIDRLYEDHVALEEELDIDIRFLSSVTQGIEDMEKLIIDYPDGANPKILSTFFETAFNLPAITGHSDTYEQLVASGDMNLLSSEQLRSGLVSHATVTRTLVHRDQAVREWSRPYLVSLVRLSYLYDGFPLEEAIRQAGSKADLIVAMRMYRNIYNSQLENFGAHKESFVLLNNQLAAAATH